MGTINWIFTMWTGSLTVIFSFLVMTSGEFWLPRSLGSFYLKDAAFVEAYHTRPLNASALYISTFNPIALFIHDPVYRIPSPGKLLDTVETWGEHLEKLGGSNTAYWPNEPLEIPLEVSGFQGIVQTSGFLVPGKKSGQLEVYNEENYQGPWNVASKSNIDWSYHWLIWHDVDDDGLLDIMTARFHVSLFGQTNSQFVWLKNPGHLGPDGTGWQGWEQFVLIENGPDVVVSMHYLDYQGTTYSVIVTGELWTERVMLYYVEDVPGAWSDSSNIKSVVVDENCGLIFETNAYDLNSDGKLELVSSSIKDQVGNLFVYLMPEDWMNSKWERKILASDFKPSSDSMQNAMSPGKFKIFYPSRDYESRKNEDGSPLKPWISLSGDDDGKHYLLFPESEDKDNWNYDLHLLIDTNGDTAGTMAIADLDGDGFQELISAGYSSNTVYVHTFKHW